MGARRPQPARTPAPPAVDGGQDQYLLHKAVPRHEEDAELFAHNSSQVWTAVRCKAGVGASVSAPVEWVCRLALPGSPEDLGPPYYLSPLLPLGHSRIPESLSEGAHSVDPPPPPQQGPLPRAA